MFLTAQRCSAPIRDDAAARKAHPHHDAADQVPRLPRRAQGHRRRHGGARRLRLHRGMVRRAPAARCASRLDLGRHLEHRRARRAARDRARRLPAALESRASTCLEDAALDAAGARVFATSSPRSAPSRAASLPKTPRRSPGRRLRRSITSRAQSASRMKPRRRTAASTCTRAPCPAASPAAARSIVGSRTTSPRFRDQKLDLTTNDQRGAGAAEYAHSLTTIQ